MDLIVLYIFFRIQINADVQRNIQKKFRWLFFTHGFIQHLGDAAPNHPHGKPKQGDHQRPKGA